MVLKMVDMLIPLGVASRGSKMGLLCATIRETRRLGSDRGGFASRFPSGHIDDLTFTILRPGRLEIRRASHAARSPSGFLRPVSQDDGDGGVALENRVRPPGDHFSRRSPDIGLLVPDVH